MSIKADQILAIGNPLKMVLVSSKSSASVIGGVTYSYKAGDDSSFEAAIEAAIQSAQSGGGVAWQSEDAVYLALPSCRLLRRLADARKVFALSAHSDWISVIDSRGGRIYNLGEAARFSISVNKAGQVFFEPVQGINGN
jgi:hypothetical protein